MCGIIGGTKRDWNYQKAIEVLVHRGPDSQQIVELKDITFAFTRLSIIDLSEKANQPMPSADKSVWIVFNGEIYDYITLRKELITKGHTFQSQSDTEVIINAYLEWGDNFVDHLDGMFAIGIYDTRNCQLKLFRDRVGIKPLYYYDDGKNFAFASEIKGLVALCHNINFELDYTALYDYLTYKYIPAPKSLYQNVFKLPPAHLLIFNLKEKSIQTTRPYWKLSIDPNPKPVSLNEANERLRATIQKSVKSQIVADVPVGFYLSGGMDSSIVVGEASALNKRINTFSIGFDDPRHTETNFAQEVAQYFNTSHHEKILTEEYTHDLYPKLKAWFDEPFSDTSAFPTYLVSQFAREKVKVVLTGDGGDEIFGGYTWYKLISNLRKFPFLKNSFLNQSCFRLKSLFLKGSFLYRALNRLEVYTTDELEALTKLLGGMTSSEKKCFQQKWNISTDYDSYWYFRQFYREDLPIRTRLQYLDFHTFLPDDILTKVDRTSMAVSLEARVPLLGKDLIELCFSFPEEIRFYQDNLKGLLKTAYQQRLPNSILKRNKKGFSIPSKYLGMNFKRREEEILKHIFHITL